jgi:hypothetical protein
MWGTALQTFLQEESGDADLSGQRETVLFKLRETFLALAVGQAIFVFAVHDSSKK